MLRLALASVAAVAVLYIQGLSAQPPASQSDETARVNEWFEKKYEEQLAFIPNAKGWSEEQAVQYFLDNAAVTEPQARSEVRRYMVLPGQATSYKIGMLKFQELRRKAEAALGDRFDIRAFHDVALSGGALPLTMLEKRIDRWLTGLAR
jgi:hypothetical protein